MASLDRTDKQGNATYIASFFDLFVTFGVLTADVAGVFRFGMVWVMYSNDKRKSVARTTEREGGQNISESGVNIEDKRRGL